MLLWEKNLSYSCLQSQFAKENILSRDRGESVDKCRVAMANTS
jgi:hypothetical protein